MLMYSILQQAFGSVPHLRLIQKLKGYGIGSSLLLSRLCDNGKTYISII